MSLHVEVKIDIILHATEDSKKIFEMLFDNFGLIKEDFIVQNLTGHFDNPITFLSINLKKKNAEIFLVKFLHKMKKNDFLHFNGFFCVIFSKKILNFYII